MGVVGGGPRHLADPAVAASWICPSCHAKNTSRFEDGCPACGAGTPAMNAAAQAAPSEPIDLRALVLGEVASGGCTTGDLALEDLTPHARTAVALALVFAVENGAAVGPLPPRALVAWARVIAGED